MTRILRHSVVAALVSLIFAGCAAIEGIRYPDGTIEVRSRRYLWASQGIDFSVKDTNGLTATLKVQRSNPDADTFGAISEGAVRGAVMARP